MTYISDLKIFKTVSALYIIFNSSATVLYLEIMKNSKDLATVCDRLKNGSQTLIFIFP